MSKFKTDEFKTDIESCRFCWMCRHVCTQGRVTRCETNTARALAMLLAGIERKAESYDKTVAEKLYQCCQCGYCREWCVSDFRAPQFIRAAREDIYAYYPELLPETVASALQSIRKNGHPYAQVTGNFEKRRESSENLLYIGSAARYLRPSTGKSALSLLDKLGIKFSTLEDEPPSGFWLWNLGAGYPFGAARLKCAESIRNSGAKRLIVVSPQDYYLFTREYGGLLEGIEIAAYPVFAKIDVSKLLGEIEGSAYSESSFYARWCGLEIAPEGGIKLFWHGSQSYASGAELCFTYPEMANNIAASALDSAIEDGAASLAVSGAEDAYSLDRAGKIKILELIELADSQL